MANVLFVCLHNAGRSQMSQALFAITANGRHQAKSAGTRPGERVHPQVVEAMRELGVDVSDRKPRALDMELAQWADVVVTMGCGDQCPYIPGRPPSTGACPTPRTSRASRSAESATTSKTASKSSSPSSTLRHTARAVSPSNTWRRGARHAGQGPPTDEWSVVRFARRRLRRAGARTGSAD